MEEKLDKLAEVVNTKKEVLAWFREMEKEESELLAIVAKGIKEEIGISWGFTPDKKGVWSNGCKHCKNAIGFGNFCTVVSKLNSEKVYREIAPLLLGGAKNLAKIEVACGEDNKDKVEKDYEFTYCFCSKYVSILEGWPHPKNKEEWLKFKSHCIEERESSLKEAVTGIVPEQEVASFIQWLNQQSVEEPIDVVSNLP